MTYSAVEHKVKDLAMHFPELLPPCLTEEIRVCRAACIMFDPNCLIRQDTEVRSLLIEEIKNIHRIYGEIDIQTEGQAIEALISILRANKVLHIDIIEKRLSRDFPALNLHHNQIVRLLSSNPELFTRIEKGVYSIQPGA
jgi:hypothetical protein